MTSTSRGKIFGNGLIGIESNNFINDGCRTNYGNMVCCAILNETNAAYSIESATILQPRKNRCSTTKVYIPSTYENDQFEIARRFDNITDFALRKRSFKDFVSSKKDLNDSYNWVSSVRRRMRFGQTENNDLDFHYLSRFKFTRICPGRGEESSWNEWIEPISVHARNPFSLLNCNMDKKGILKSLRHFSKTITDVNVMNTDHVLLHYDQRSQSTRGRNFMLDAGTSSFGSSLWWFTCMYLHRNITFDKIYGWEYTLLEPKAFWSEVPKKIISRYHFYNAGMSDNMTDWNSPLRIVEQIATQTDFVSFKLDIDNGDVEIATLLKIMQNKLLQDLIDEFFFELHFRCEVMLTCGWEYDSVRVPEEILGVKLSRTNVMTIFQRLRIMGIRSHFWP